MLLLRQILFIDNKANVGINSCQPHANGLAILILQIITRFAQKKSPQLGEFQSCGDNNKYYNLSSPILFLLYSEYTVIKPSI